MITISQITVEGFRGFAKERSLAFDAPIVLLFGENGTGKSSTLNAIEWCLFGKECTGGSTGIRERVGWQIANRFAAPERVQVVLRGGIDGGRFTLTRASASGRTGRTKETLELVVGGDTLVGDEADTHLQQLFVARSEISLQRSTSIRK